MEPENASAIFDNYLFEYDLNENSTINYPENSIDELYHVNSKNTSLDELNTVSSQIKDLISQQPKRHSDFTVQLDEESKVDKKTKDILESRESTRNFKQYDIQLPEISAILKNSYGYKENERSYPSAGALYPVEIYWFNLSDNSLDRAIYRYSLFDSNLSKVQDLEAIKPLFMNQIQENVNLQKISGFFGLTGVFNRLRMKYGSRGYRYTLIESGHIAQNILLIAEELNLDTLPIGGFYDRKVEDVMELDGIEESILYMIGVGKNE